MKATISCSQKRNCGAVERLSQYLGELDGIAADSLCEAHENGSFYLAGRGAGAAERGDKLSDIRKS